MRVKSESKRQEIIEAAGKLFLSEGYAGTSLVAVAAAAQCTRPTLYGYFPTKDSIFRAFVVEAGRDHFESLHQIPRTGTQSLNEQLTVIARTFLKLICEPSVIAIHRLIIGESHRFPELARIFYETGPNPVGECIASMLSDEMELGNLRHATAETMALHFMGLCGASTNEYRLWGLGAPPDAKRIDVIATEAVASFLDGYGPC